MKDTPDISALLQLLLTCLCAFKVIGARGKKTINIIFLGFHGDLTVKFCQIAKTEHQILTPNTGIGYASLETMVEGFQCNSKHIYTKADLVEDAQNCSLKQSQNSCRCKRHCLEKCYKLYLLYCLSNVENPLTMTEKALSYLHVKDILVGVI